MLITKLLKFTAPALLAVSGLCSCNNDRSRTSTADDFSALADTLTHHARYLTIADIGGGTVLVDIADPWNDGRYLSRYALVHRDSITPDNLPSDVAVVRTPVQKAVVYSSIHTGALAELNALDALVAVADAAYFPDGDPVKALLDSGKIADIGPSASPSLEKIVASGAEIVVRSPYEGIPAGDLPTHIVPVEMADYLETSPVSRAEWWLLLGELTGRRELARKIFTQVIDSYSDLAFKASTASSPRPKVLTELEQSGVWYVPAGESYAARLLADAGADYPWADTEGTGSLTLSIEKVAERAIDADIWLLRTYGYTLDAASLIRVNPRYAAFKAAKEGRVYGCDSESTSIFYDMAFHPDRVLAEYAALFHPDVLPDYQFRYFTHK